jgi:hypothetical protein
MAALTGAVRCAAAQAARLEALDREVDKLQRLLAALASSNVKGSTIQQQARREGSL